MNHAAKKFKIICVPLLIILILLVFKNYSINRHFDPNHFDPLRIRQDVETLSSSYFAGKSCGSPENDEAIVYIQEIFESLGLKPAGDAGGYLQRFKIIMPKLDLKSDFHINDEQGNPVRQFLLYKDYRILPSGRGSGIDYSGELLLAGHNLYNINPLEIRDRIVLVESILPDEKKIDYVFKKQGKGILFVSPNNWADDPRTAHPDGKSFDLSEKKSCDLFIGSISREVYRFLKNRTGVESLFGKEAPLAVLPNIVIRSQISFPLVQTANILGMLEGRGSEDRILMISASLDGLGRGEGAHYFPGAVNSNSGVAVLLETARVLSVQKNLPYKRILFSVWNGEENNAAGARYYANHPLYPLNETTVIHLDGLGAGNDSLVQVCSDSTYGSILRSQIVHFSQDEQLPAVPFGISGTNSPVPFLNRKMATVLLKSNGETRNTYEDQSDFVDFQGLESAALILLNYLRRSVYKDLMIDYLNPCDKWIFRLLLGFLILNYLINSIYVTYPNLYYRAFSIEKIYYHPLGILLRKSIYYLLPLGLAVFLLVFIVHLPGDNTLRRINGETVSNFSSYLSVKNTLMFIKGFLSSNLSTSANNKSLFEVVYTSTMSSLKLLSVSLLFSFVWGIGRGVYESWHDGNQGAFRAAGTLVSASIPDVIVVIAGLWIYVFVARKFPDFNELINLKEFILPLLTLSLLPAAYVSRITSICIRDELNREYIRNARAKGFSRVQIYLVELVPPVLSKVLDSFSALSSLMLTNLIIVEYLFNYKGIIYYLLYFYKRQDGSSFISLCFSVALLYLFVTSAGHLGSILINPLKRKRVL